MTPTPRDDARADAVPSGWDEPESMAHPGVDDTRPLLPHLRCTVVEEAELARIVQCVVHHDEHALSTLYRLMAARVYRQAIRLTHEMTAAEEVVEDVFWQVWRQAPRFDPARGSVSAWLMQLTRSRAIDALRALSRSPLAHALQMDLNLLIEQAAEHDASHHLDHLQLAQRIDDALRSLDPLRRQLVTLAFHSGLSHEEIAEQTGLPLGTVKSNIRRGLAAMKTALQHTMAGRPRAGGIT